MSGNSPLDAPEKLGVQYFSGIMRGGVSDYYNWTQTSGGQEQTITTYATTHFVNQSISWINQQQRPYFLWLAFNAPHTPFHRPPLNLIKDQSLADNAAEIRSNPLPYEIPNYSFLILFEFGYCKLEFICILVLVFWYLG